MRFAVFVALLAQLWYVEAIGSVQGFFRLSKDGGRLERIFRDGLVSKDLSSVFYASNGLKQLNVPLTDTKQSCQDIVTLMKDPSTSIESSYYGVSAFKDLKCQGSLDSQTSVAAAKKVLGDAKSSTSDIMYSLLVLKANGNKDYNKEALIKTLQESLKKDDSVTNLGHVFHICAEIGCGSWAVERIEDALIQADEVDGKMLHWEGGLPVTALVLTGILGLAEAEKKPSQITQEQSIKFANYLLSRRTVQTVKGGAVLLETMAVFVKDATVSPICISLNGNGQIKDESESVQVVVSDLFGRQHPSVKPDSVIAQSATRLSDDVVVLSKQKLVQDQKDVTIYKLDLMKVKPERGQYKIALSAGTASAALSVRVLGAVDIDGIEVGVGDIDGSSTPRLTAVKYPNRLAQTIEADSLQKIIVKFILREKGQTKIAKVHQAFVRIFNKKTEDEVIFVAEQDSAKTYKMDVDVGSVSERFEHESGLYGIELIIGDVSISNSFRWVLADVTLKFTTRPDKDAKASKPVRGKKPEIKHIFREPEVRPPRLVSDIFTGLCIAPLFLLFILWGKIGINIRNFPFSLSAFGFHLGFGAILGLFVVFWLKLTMFETIKYLLALGLITFICGNRLLRGIASKRKRA